MKDEMSGYVSPGGELKNGRSPRKYKINNENPNYIVVSKVFLVCVFLLFIAGMLFVFLLTFFLSQTTCETIPIPEKIVLNHDEPIRLPENFVPSHYRLILDPYIPDGYTDGQVWINVTSADTDPTILVDIGDIEIDADKVAVLQYKCQTCQGVKVDVTSAGYLPNNETRIYYEIVISPSPEVGSNYSVYIPFRGKLNDQLQGFYKSSYVDKETGERRWLASTQFSPTDARRAFPCFDRPGFKATFEISMIHPASLKAMSNMPVNHSAPHKNRTDIVVDHFQTTPRMSTYLVAFIVSDLAKGAPESLQNQTTAYTISAWARKDYIDQLDFTSSISVELIKYYEKYFDIPFPLPKIDIVAVPEFGFNAMENWGLIIYRESACLVPPSSTSELTKHSVSKTVAHETAHQWFGNLVTPQFWNDLWLKEGFATYVGYIGINEVFPDWDMDGRFVIEQIQLSLFEDSNILSHPISYSVETEAQIRSLFDPISYSKGASLIRMMHNFLGDHTFKSGLIKYLKAFSFANVKQDDLWNSLTEQAHGDGSLPANITMKEIMDTWTLQTGYPVLNVKRTSNGIYVNQRHFILPNEKAANDTTWWIPVSVVTQDDQDFNNSLPVAWLPSKHLDQKIEVDFRKDSWFIVNVNQSGFYRVNYEDRNWELLIAAYPNLPELTRSQLIDDGMFLARGDQLEYNVTLGLITKLSHDISPLPWAAAERQIMYLLRMMSKEPAYGLFKAFMNAAVSGVYKEVTLRQSRESHSKALLRSTVVNTACAVDLIQCLSEAQIAFREWMRNEEYNLIPPDVKRPVYCTAIRRGGVEEWDFALRMFKESSIATDKEVLLDALGCATEPWLLSKYLDLTLAPNSPFSKQDGHRIFSSVASNKFGHDIAVSHFIGHFKQIYDYYGEGFGTVRKMIESMSEYMNKENDKIMLETFAKELTELGVSFAHTSVTKLLEVVKNNIYWRDNRYPNLEKWLTEFNTLYHLV